MLLEPLYRATFTTPESWTVEISVGHGAETQSFLIAEGRCEGRVAARYRGANFPRQRADGTVLPDFRGVLETDDGASVLFSWRGYAGASPDGSRQLVGAMFHVTDDDRYRWLNTAVCTLVGEVRPREGENGVDVTIEVAELVPEAPR